jgi:hypothetical protein
VYLDPNACNPTALFDLIGMYTMLMRFDGIHLKCHYMQSVEGSRAEMTRHALEAEM